MKCINSVQLAYGDECTYEVEEHEIVMRPYYGYNDRNKFDMKEAVAVGSYANGQPKFEFITRVDGKAIVKAYHSIGD